MYKDPDKQREAVKAAIRRYRGKGGDSALPGHRSGIENARGLAVVDGLGITGSVIPPKCDTQPVIPKCAIPNGDTDISAVKALHQLVSNPRQGLEPKPELNKRQIDKIANELSQIADDSKPKRGKDIKRQE